MNQYPKIVTDHLGNRIPIAAPPKRIISLVPSQTELLIDLCGVDRVVGRTKFCVHPKKTVSEIKKIGGTKNLDMEAINSLQPDLIIGNKEENTKEQIETLSQIYPTWVADVSNVKQALQLVIDIGIITNTQKKANLLVLQIRGLLSKIKNRPFIPVKVLYLIWKDPFMTVGGDTFIADMMNLWSFINVCKNRDRYPEITLTEIKSAKPEFIFLSSEPYPFREKHREEMKDCFPESEILLVDGEMFSWYGSRLLKGIPYIGKLKDSIVSSR